MIEQNVKNKYYVYIYLDPLKPGEYVYDEYHFKYEPFYVGKGCNGRDRSHLKGCTHNKEFKQRIDIIKENTGVNPIIERLWNNLSEIDAYSIEWKIMKKIGTKYSKSCQGPLYNKAFATISDISLRYYNKQTIIYTLHHPYVREDEICIGKYDFIRFCKKVKLDYNTLLNGETVNGWKLKIL